MAEDSYLPDPQSCSPTQPLGDWERIPGVEKDNFYACAYKHNRANLMVVAFRGTDDARDGLIDDLTGIGFAATLALHTNEALDFAQRMQKSCKDLWLTGHSLGGAYVQLIGAKLGLPGVTFNAPGVLNLVNMAAGGWRKAVGLTGGAVSDILGYRVPSLLNQVFAGDAAYPPVANYRGSWDPVSRIGVHVGAPLQEIHTGIHENPHAIRWIVAALAKRSGAVA